MTQPTFEEIKARHAEDEKIAGSLSKPARRRHDDRGALIEMVEALKHLARPVGSPKGTSPVVLYLGSEADRQELIDAFKEVKPNWRSVKVP